MKYYYVFPRNFPELGQSCCLQVKTTGFASYSCSISRTMSPYSQFVVSVAEGLITFFTVT